MRSPVKPQYRCVFGQPHRTVPTKYHLINGNLTGNRWKYCKTIIHCMLPVICYSQHIFKYAFYYSQKIN